MKRFLVLLIAACLTACNLDVADPGDHPTDPTTETFDPSLGVDLSTMIKTPGGAYYKDLKVGTGPVLVGQPMVLYTYVGFVKNGASFASGQQASPESLQMLIEGLQEGMQGMQVGGQRLIVVPSELGFGANASGSVPPNSTLIFDIQLDGLPQ